MTTIRKWTGHETRALREVLRMSIPDFAERLAISENSLSKWESEDTEKALRADSQAMLDMLAGESSGDGFAQSGAFLENSENSQDVKSGIEIPIGLAPKEVAHATVRATGIVIPSIDKPRSLDDPIYSLVQKSAQEATALTMSAGSDLIDPNAIDQLFDEVERLATLYITSTAGVDRRVLEEATTLRNSLQSLLGAYRKPAQASDINLLIGLLSGICAYACLDLGFPGQAIAQVRASFVMGDLAGHDGLRAWALGTRSLIERFQGQYSAALRHSREGMQYATSGTALVRLRCGEGQTLAHLGDAGGTIDALDLAKEARDRVNSADVMGGLFTFTEAKQAYYSGSSLQWLPGKPNAKSSERESLRAIQMFRDSDPQNRSLADELLAHVYLANSRLTTGEIEGSIEALRPVLDLSPSERNSWHRKRMQQIASRLDRGKFTDSRLAISAREEISSFAENPE